MAPKRRAEGAGCVFLGKTRRGAGEERREKGTREYQQEKRRTKEYRWKA